MYLSYKNLEATNEKKSNSNKKASNQQTDNNIINSDKKNQNTNESNNKLKLDNLNNNETVVDNSENKVNLANKPERGRKSIENENKKIEIADNSVKEVNDRKRFYAIDGNGLGTVNTEIVKCASGLEVEVVNSQEGAAKADFTYALNSVNAPEPSKRNGKKDHYYMVYAMESEPHSSGGNTWLNADFRMWYNLELSFPEPATYFDVKLYLPELLSPPKIEFEQKETSAPLVWVLSNCHAFNAREKFVSKLMKLINVDSYGFCLRNKHTHTSNRMQGNIELFSKYKFVIAIENSNCEDYITEKLVHAVASGSIPIVAGKDNKPNYARFLPKNSYINIYDFKTVEDLVSHINKVGSSKEEYEKYLYFKRNHNYTRDYIKSLSLDKVIELSQTIMPYEDQKTFYDGIIFKEKSENKLCKIARYLKNTPRDQIRQDIEAKRINRPDTAEACLPHGNLGSDF